MGMIYRPKYKAADGTVRESAVWWLKFYRNGKAVRQSADTTKESEAKRILKVREGEVARGAPITSQTGRVRFDELKADVLTDYKTNGKKSLDKQEDCFNHLDRVFAGRRATSISTAEIRKYIEKRQSEKAANATINRELSALGRAFSLGMQAGKLLHKPYIPMLQENNARKGFFHREQFEAVRRRLSPALQAVVTFAYLTGWRTRSEVLPLQWRQVDFQAGTVRLDPGTTKNREGRVFPMTVELRELLEAQRDERDRMRREHGKMVAHVFHRGGKPIRGLRRAWATACRDAGCPGMILHDFRRSAVRNLVRADIPERVAMMMTGHKTRSVFERYNIVDEGDLTDAAKRLDAAVGKVSGKVAPESASESGSHAA